MEITEIRPRSPAEYCLTATPTGVGASKVQLAHSVYARTCRTDFDAPGFCLINLGNDISSQELRRFIVDLKTDLQQFHSSVAGRGLAWLSAGRFDQQVTTKFHRDGGPDECLLILGYEPSPVRAEVSMADYSHCAFDLGLTPAQFLEQHNPMFARGNELLRPYVTTVACFSNTNSQILVINNSIADYSENARRWQGVLHTAQILTPSDADRRVVNSTMVESVAFGTPDSISEADLADFVKTTTVRRRGYDKPHLDDDK